MPREPQGLPTALAVVPAGPTTAANPTAALGQSPTRKLKLSSVVDPTLDAEITQIESGEISRLYQEYSAKYGACPAPEVDPTGDQLSALLQLIRAQAIPYVDLSIWGPFGLRSLRKQVFTSYILNAATGEWSKKEAPGPPNIMAWERGFRTFKCAMLLLQAADSERLDSYMDFVKDLNDQFSHDCWGIIYTKLRFECGPNTWNASRGTSLLTQSMASQRPLLGVQSSTLPPEKRSIGPVRSRLRPRCSWLEQRAERVEVQWT